MKNNFTYNDSNEFINQILASKIAIECMTWLTESDTQQRTLGEDIESTISIAFVKSLNDSGAKQVWVFDIDDYGDEGQNSGKLIIELPEDPDQRLKLFKMCGDIANNLGYDAEVDTNQKAIFLMLD